MNVEQMKFWLRYDPARTVETRTLPEKKATGTPDRSAVTHGDRINGFQIDTARKEKNLGVQEKFSFSR